MGRAKDIMRCSRLVTLPGWQGLGLALNLIDRMGACYKAVGKRCRTYPAHPSLIRSFDRSPRWRLITAPGSFSKESMGRSISSKHKAGRPYAVFEYCGPTSDAPKLAASLLS